ncbi:hypothetical protein Ae717Ps2_6099c [Pseudonocardia sp. Ae717_Ps2]|nr:hypothetical protein Ae717Ps2_6099c [Pseudonocardia sp. Ae717_Ps2]
MTDSPRKGGRKHLGERRPTMVRLREDLWEAVQEIAQREGLPVSAVITRMVAESLDRPVPDYCQPKTAAVRSTQEELPVPQAS